MGLTRIRAEQISDIDYKQAVRVITVTNITLSGGAPALVDGVSLATNDRVLVKDQNTGSQNGIYYVQTVGAGSNGTWVRAQDGNATGELQAGLIIMVTEGDIYKDTQWKLTTNNPIVVGSTALVFEQNSAFAFGNIYANGTAVLANTVGDTVTFTAGTNIQITGNALAKSVTIGVTGLSLNSISNGTSNVNVVSSGGNVSVGVGGTSNVAVFATTGEYVTGVISASGNVTGGNLLTGGLISSTGNITGGNISATAHTGTSVSVTGTVTAASVVGGVITGTSTSVTGATTAASVVGGVITGTSTSVTGTTTAASVVGGVITGSSLSVTGNISGGNVLGGANVNATTHTGTTVSVTGNITGGNVLGGANVNATTHTGTTVSVTGNITGGNVLFGSGIVSGTGNITGGFFFGNGSQLTGITGGGGGSSITNGTSNVTVALNGNVTVGISSATVTTFATTGIFVPGLASVTGNVSIGNAAGVTFANAGGVRAWTYYNNTAASLDTVFL